MEFRKASFCFAAVCLVLSAAGQAFAKIEVEAFAGEPFGIARVSFAMSEAPGIVDLERVRVTEAEGRAVYPSAAPGAVGRLFGLLLKDAGPLPIGRVNIAFLFRGNEPFDVTLHLPTPVEIRVTPRAVPARQFARELDTWFRDYQQALTTQTRDGDFQPIVQTYLTTMLSKRLGLAPPPAPVVNTGKAPSETQQTLELMLGLEQFHNQKLYEAMLGLNQNRGPANLPLPKEFEWPNPEVPATPDGQPLAIEEIAKHVPAECFYIRFGRFNNYLWFDNLQDEYGGDLSTMVTLRALEIPMSERGEKQLGLEKNALADLFGEAAILDVALIGRDTFLEEGAAIGILFQGRNELLENDIRTQQKKALAQFKDRGATLESVKIAGRDVDFLSTPDNRLRSFHATDGMFHLVTTSRVMVERFFEVGEGKRSLADSAEFKHARAKMPIKREDTLFAFFSPQFFEGLLTPQYQVELHRRMRSIVEMELLQMAQLAANNEGLPQDVDSLIAAGLLPKDFGQRPDESRIVATETGLADSLRGPRGHFLPITDIEIQGITAEDSRRCQAQLESLAANWGSMDPLVIGLKRFSLNKDGLERLVIDASISPLDETKYGWLLSVVGPPTKTMAKPLPDDIITVQAAISGGDVMPLVPPHLLFLGVKDLPALGDARPTGLLGMLQTIKSSPGYIGGWPKPGFIDLLPFGLAGEPDQFGFSQIPIIGAWRWQGSGYSILSFDKQILTNAASNIQMVEAEVPAQIRIHAGNLAESKIAPTLNAMSLDRSLSASRGNTRLMHALTQQLGVPTEEAKATAERLLDAKFVCPFGGEYALAEEDGNRRWVSTKWPSDDMPATDYHSPVLDWFRGLDVYMVKTDEGIDAHAELDLQRKPSQAKFEIPPIFNLNNIFGGGQKAVKPKEEIKTPPPATDPQVPKIEVPAPPKPNPPLPSATGTDQQSVLKKKAAEPAPFDELPAPEKTPPKPKREF